MSRLRFAQVGVTAIHASMYRETLGLIDDAELVGFYDPDPATAQARLSEAHRALPFAASVAELVERTRPDAVLVSGIVAQMPELALPAVRAGVHLWLEKPCAAFADQLLPVAAAIEQHRLHFSTGYSWRFHPASQLIRETLDAGLLGRLSSIEVRFITSSVTRRGPGNWPFQRALSGGGILNWLGCHWIDQMRALSGAEITQVAAIEANVGGHAIDVEDMAAVALRFDNGMVGSLHTGYLTAGDSELFIGLRGSDGWIRWDVDQESLVIKSAHPSWATAPQRSFAMPLARVPGYGAEGLALMRRFCDAIRGVGTSGYRIEDAIATLRVIEAAHHAAATGTTTRLEVGNG